MTKSEVMPADLNRIRLYRMTHIDNIPHILNHGLTHSSSVNSNPNYKSIGDSSIIEERNGKQVLERPLSAGIPFYFGFRMPMLYVIQHGHNSVQKVPASEIVYCVSTVAKIVACGADFVFTDGHCLTRITRYFEKKDIENVEQIVDFEAVGAKYWKNSEDHDLKRRKEAELIVFNDLALLIISGYIVYDQSAHDRLIEYGVSPDKIAVRPKFYFDS